MTCFRFFHGSPSSLASSPYCAPCRPSSQAQHGRHRPNSTPLSHTLQTLSLTHGQQHHFVYRACAMYIATLLRSHEPVCLMLSIDRLVDSLPSFFSNACCRLSYLTPACPTQASPSTPTLALSHMQPHIPNHPPSQPPLQRLHTCAFTMSLTCIHFQSVVARVSSALHLLRVTS